MLNQMLQRLTDNYKKEPTSKIGKLFKIVADELEEVKNTLEKTERYRDIDQATGTTLDKIGVNVQQFRGVANDDIYKILIKSKIARNLSTGDINTLIDVLSVTLNTQVQNIQIIEEYPASVSINIPTDLLNEAGFSLNQFGRLVNRIVAGGVKAKVLFEGTFSFASQLGEIELDGEKGFSDLDQETGGYFGAVYDPGTDIDLPI